MNTTKPTTEVIMEVTEAMEATEDMVVKLP